MGRPRNETEKKSHLSQDERITIQEMLSHGNSPYQISLALGKSASTITREINNHAVNYKANQYVQTSMTVRNVGFAEEDIAINIAKHACPMIVHLSVEDLRY